MTSEWETYSEVDWNGLLWEVVRRAGDYLELEAYVPQGDGTRRIVRCIMRRDACHVSERARLVDRRPQRRGPHHVT